MEERPDIAKGFRPRSPAPTSHVANAFDVSYPPHKTALRLGRRAPNGEIMTNIVFRSGRRRATVLKWLFVASIVAQILYLVSVLAHMWLLRRGAADTAMAKTAASIYLGVSVGAFLYVTVYLAAAATFLIWLYRVRANLPALGIEDARWGPGWAVGWWFVPVMNFVAPFMVVRDVWKASGPEADPGSWRKLPTPPQLWWWWGSWLMGSAVISVGWGLSLQARKTLADTLNASIADSIGTTFIILCTAFATMIVSQIDRRQAARHAALGGPA